MRTAFILAHAQGRCASDTRKRYRLFWHLAVRQVRLLRYELSFVPSEVGQLPSGGLHRGKLSYCGMNRVCFIKSMSVAVRKDRCICCEFCNTSPPVSSIKRTFRTVINKKVYLSFSRRGARGEGPLYQRGPSPRTNSAEKTYTLTKAQTDLPSTWNLPSNMPRSESPARSPSMRSDHLPSGRGTSAASSGL